MSTDMSTFYSTSAYVEQHSSASFSAISASNYQSLNSEGGACYRTTTQPYKARRPGDGTLAIGETEFRSPIGDVPWGLIALLIMVYVAIKRVRTIVAKRTCSGK